MALVLKETREDTHARLVSIDVVVPRAGVCAVDVKLEALGEVAADAHAAGRPQRQVGVRQPKLGRDKNIYERVGK